MAASSPIDVVLKTMECRWMWDMRAFAQNVVGDLRSAGWMREEACVGPCGEGAIKRLTRERDEARAGARNYWRSRYEEVFGELAEALATQSSPEVLAVVEAAKAARGRWRESQQDGYWYPEVRALIAAVDALAASQRKAEPKPEARKFWTTEVWPNGSIQQFGVQRGSEWHGPFPAGVCHALAIALNAADAAGRKS